MNDWTLKYFPERFRRRDPEACRMAAALMAKEGHHLPTLTVVEKVTRHFVGRYNGMVETMPFEDRPERPGGLISQAGALAIHLGRFQLSGRQVYDISRDTLDLLDGADYRDIPYAMLALPFDSLYLHFGPQDFAIAGRAVEGAILHRYKASVEILFVTESPNGWQDGNFVTQPTAYLYLPLTKANDPDASLAQVVERCVDELRDELMQAGETPESHCSFAGVVTVDRRGAGARKDLDALNVALSQVDRAMSLTVNALLYIMSYPENVHSRWSEGTPGGLACLADGAGRPGKVVEAKTKIIKDGYYKVNFVSAQVGDSHEGEGGGSVKSPHWRRAHWRLQPVGPGRQQRRAILIRPVLVNADKVRQGDEIPGRVNLV